MPAVVQAPGCQVFTACGDAGKDQICCGHNLEQAIRGILKGGPPRTACVCLLPYSTGDDWAKKPPILPPLVIIPCEAHSWCTVSQRACLHLRLPQHKNMVKIFSTREPQVPLTVPVKACLPRTSRECNPATSSQVECAARPAMRYGCWRVCRANTEKESANLTALAWL